MTAGDEDDEVAVDEVPSGAGAVPAESRFTEAI